ncbi:unnamed protein product [Rangifer tarandus platyrhynchus]|uniref:Ferritin n=1 Tax=Rangifer tarandus platyrhynchus TaxID=3082113 RepID=A0ABN9A7G7_RANTA|nr:unnamed protein product [Rangifer tarandus platyrhynchus]
MEPRAWCPTPSTSTFHHLLPVTDLPHNQFPHNNGHFRSIQAVGQPLAGQPLAIQLRVLLCEPSWLTVGRLRGGGWYLRLRCFPSSCCLARCFPIRETCRMMVMAPAVMPAEAVVNSPAALELHKSFQCLAGACALHHHHDVALKLVAHFLLLLSLEHSKRAKSLMFLLNRNGSRVSFLDVRMPETQERESSLQAMQDTLHLEKSVSQSLLDLHHLATDGSNAHLCHFLEMCHLDQQLEFIEELGDHLTSMRKMRSWEGGLVE